MSRKGRRVHHQEAFQLYLAMGAKRSLAKVVEHYVDSEDIGAPGLTTIKRWARQNHWTARAREHDWQVAERTHEIAVAETAQVRWDAAKGVLAVAQRVHDRLLEVVPQSTESVEDLTKALIELVKTAEVLQGGTSDRAAVTMAEEGERADLNELLRRMNEVLKKGNGSTGH